MECEYCYATDDVSEGYDPYALEIDGELKEIIACGDCYRMLAADV